MHHPRREGLKMYKQELVNFVSNLPEELYATPVQHEELKYSVQLDLVNYPVLKDRACKSPIDQPQLS